MPWCFCRYLISFMMFLADRKTSWLPSVFVQNVHLPGQPLLVIMLIAGSFLYVPFAGRYFVMGSRSYAGIGSWSRFVILSLGGVVSLFAGIPTRSENPIVHGVFLQTMPLIWSSGFPAMISSVVISPSPITAMSTFGFCMTSSVTNVVWTPPKIVFVLG